MSSCYTNLIAEQISRDKMFQAFMGLHPLTWLELFLLFSSVSSLIARPPLSLSLLRNASSLAFEPGFPSASTPWIIGGSEQVLLRDPLCKKGPNIKSASKRACRPSQPPVMAPGPVVRYECANTPYSIDGDDCVDAWDDIPRHMSGGEIEYFNFGNRSSPVKWDVPLPFRFISRKLMVTPIDNLFASSSR